MTREQARDEAKRRLEDYLNMVSGKKGNQYVCPVCGSGTGANKTPAGYLYKDGQVFHCYSCNFHGDIFELCAKVENIINAAEKFKRVYEIFNIEVDLNYKNEPLKDYTAYFNKCAARVSETDYFARRGLSKRVIEKYGLGYDPNWISPAAQAKGSKMYPSKRVIIPTSPNSYLARAVDPDNNPAFKVIKEGRAEIFNKNALKGEDLIFVVEGEFDALSVIEAGGQALALGSTGNKNKFIELCKKEFPVPPVILSLDNDDAGRRTQAEIADALRNLNIAFLEQNISGEYKDPNEFLTSDAEAFKAIINADYLQVFKEEAEASSEKYISETYINETSVTSKIEEFLGVIKASVDTPVIPTGFKALDNILDDGLYEGLYIISAAHSSGKTSFALQIADQIAQQEQDVLIFSLEMARVELMAKSISRISFVKDPELGKTVRDITSGKRHLD
jgi:replicative DNA helicase